MLEEVWADDSQYADPNRHLRGRAEVAQHIVTFHRECPGARFEYSELDVHHRFLRFAWTLWLADGTIANHGMDRGEIAPDGRLRAIVIFFEPPPRAP